jgi:hypothetical protein
MTVSDWDPPKDGEETLDMFLDWSEKQGYLHPLYQLLFQPDIVCVPENIIPGRKFKYKPIEEL